MNSKKTIAVNKKAVASSFSKAAGSYDQFAQLQRDIGSILLADLAVQQAGSILDLGCGTGYFSEKLSGRYPCSQIYSLDLSAAMLAQTAKKEIAQLSCLQGDIDNLPFTDNCLDLIFSNLVVQWSANLGGCLKQLQQSLKKGGKLHFSTLLQGSLHELTQAWKAVDHYPHTNSFVTLDRLENELKLCGFKKVKITTEMRTLHYKNVLEVMRALKGIGANHVHGQQPLTVKGRRLISLLEQGYLPFINKQGLLNLTYRVCYVEAQK